MSLSMLFGILAAMLLLSAFFSGSETALMALNRYRLRHLVKLKHLGAIKALRLLQRPDRLLGMILLGNIRTSLDPKCGRDITPWRLWKALNDEAITLITGALYWKPEQRKAAVDVLKERPRRRKLQTLPLPVAKLIMDLS
jgi:hypothetical protein